MKFSDAIDEYIRDMVAEGRLNGANSIAAYRARLNHLADVAGNRDPAKIGRTDIKRALERWPNPNSRKNAHAVYRSFFDYAMEEGWRGDSPARQVRKAKGKPVVVYRLTRSEVAAMLDAADEVTRHRWLVRIGLLAGVRREELTLLQGRHFARDGWVWVSQDIGKGGRERWMPVLDELVDVVDEIRRLIPHDHYVLGSRRNARTDNTAHTIANTHPLSTETIYRDVKAVAARAGLPDSVGPHTLRHAFGDHVAKYAGLRAAQALMGHSSVETTAGTYVDRPTLDEISISVQGFRYRELPPTNQTPTTHHHADAR